MIDIEQKVRKHYQSQSLKAEKLDALISTEHQLRRQRTTQFAMAAVAAFIALGVLLMPDNSKLVTHQEAAVNHALQLKLEFDNSDINELATVMNKLPFTPTLPASLSIDKSSVLGARYCTVNGNIAAHVKFLDKNQDQESSLFMTEANASLKKLSSSSSIVDNVSVNLWEENGIFYVLAQTLTDSPESSQQ